MSFRIHVVLPLFVDPERQKLDQGGKGIRGMSSHHDWLSSLSDMAIDPDSASGEKETRQGMKRDDSYKDGVARWSLQH